MAHRVLMKHPGDTPTGIKVDTMCGACGAELSRFAKECSKCGSVFDEEDEWVEHFRPIDGIELVQWMKGEE